MKFGFDLDDTLADTASVINKYAIKFDKEFLNKTGNFKKIDNSKDYYYFADALNWTDDNIKDFFDIYYLDILKEVKVKPHVKETIKKLNDNNNMIYIITARREKEKKLVENITIEWLKQNDIKYERLIINAKDKSEVVNQFNINYFIDDSYQNCVDVIEKTDAEVYMLETEFNKGINNNKIKTITSIKDLLN